MNIQDLVTNYEANRASYLRSTYNETQLRNDFIDPLLKCFGWDVDNEAGKSQFLRDVIQEEPIDVEGEASKKNPDYTLRLNGVRKLFVEAKKPAVDIVISAKSAFQIRRYGWNANLGISILTNFENLIIYDCRYRPDATDDERIARIKVFHYKQYVEDFSSIQEFISFQSASSGHLDNLFSVYENVGQTFDNYFLVQIESWRTKLAKSAIERNELLDDESINFLIQRLLNRIIFLRICEDRSIEVFETLKQIRSYEELKRLFQHADRKYNSGLFDFIEDTLSLRVDIDADILISIFNDLYYPHSPYDFSVVDPAILSQIYERFLGSRIVVDESRQLSILEEPEVSASKGVVPTPKIIVEKIVNETLVPLVEGKTFHELSSLKIADICCGSGTFLLSAYDFLLRTTIEKIIQEGITDNNLVYQTGDNTWSLSLNEKRNILEQCIFGVDINPYASEVTEFSLLLKLLEGESEATVENFINQYEKKVLPSLSDNIKSGNSLVDQKFYEFMPSAIDDDELLYRIKPFKWEEEYPFLNETNGFDAIIGNPPYVRIQNLVKHAPEEVKYFQSAVSGYAVAKKEAVDKYFVFIQRAIALLNTNGYLGYIVPHKFFINKGGSALRIFITSNSKISKIIHFGVAQVFPDRATYTAILILQRGAKEYFSFKRLKNISSNLLVPSDGYRQYPNNNFNSEPWIFLNPDTERVFEKLKHERTLPLKRLAEISVGLQTSADDVYIFKPISETENTFRFKKNDVLYEVEKSICLNAIYKLKDIHAFDTISANAKIIFPYDIVNGKAELFSEEKLARYPLALSYLASQREKLLKRNIDKKSVRQHYDVAERDGVPCKVKWYQFGRSQSLTRFHNTPKLIWSVLATKPPYILDNDNLQFTGGGNGPYYSLLNRSEYSILYFMGILSHPLFENLVKAGASEFRGAYYSHGKQFIENLPIHLIDPENNTDVNLYNQIVTTVSNIIKSKVELSAAYGPRRTFWIRKIKLLENQLTQLINQLYGITDAEFAIVMNDEMFTAELNQEE